MAFNGKTTDMQSPQKIVFTRLSSNEHSAVFYVGFLLYNLLICCLSNVILKGWIQEENLSHYVCLTTKWTKKTKKP